MDEEAAKALDRSNLIEPVAEAIAREYLGIAEWQDPMTDEQWANHWQRWGVDRRERFRRQAQAALQASHLLERVDELEQKIRDAQEELSDRSAAPDFNVWRQMDRVRRILSSPTRREQPIRYRSR